MANRGIGKGLSALLPSTDSPDNSSVSLLRTLSIGQIEPNPHQPRAEIEPGALAELAQSISAKGVLQPILVRELENGRFELIAGERRWRAAKQAGLSEIPAIVRTEDNAGSLELAVIENMAREDLNAIDEARACTALVERCKLSHEQVGKRVGRSRAAVTNLIRLLELPDEVLESIERGELSEGHGRAILQASDHEQRRRLAKRVRKEDLSVRATEAAARSTLPEERRKALKAVDPDREDARRRVEDELSAALGVEVRIRWRKRGGAVEVPFAEDADLQALMERLLARLAA